MKHKEKEIIKLMEKNEFKPYVPADKVTPEF